MNSHRPRVLFVGAFPANEREVFGGMVTSCRALLLSSLPERLDLDLLDSTQASHPPPSLPLRLILAVRRFIAFLIRFSRHRPDAVLLFTAIGASVVEKGAMAWYCRLRGVPALIFPRGGPLIDLCRESRFTRCWVRLAFRGARMILCQGSVWRDFACDVLGFDSKDAPVVPNWTAPEEFMAVGRARNFRVTQTPRLLFVGWLDKEKGIAELLTACNVLAREHRFELALVGEGNMSELARTFVKDHRLESTIKFCGWCRGDDLLKEYALADIFVLPSWAEGLPNAMIEAMATRLAIVVTRVGNVPDVVVDDTSALMIEPRNSEALAAALARMIGDSSLQQRLANAAFVVAAERFNVESAVMKIEHSVRRAMQASKSVPTSSAGQH